MVAKLTRSNDPYRSAITFSRYICVMFICAYTDGACSGNPGPGGWGVIITATKDKNIIKKIELNGGEKHTTNNRMELTAAINALNALERPSTITILSLIHI
mgnify:FL=1